MAGGEVKNGSNDTSDEHMIEKKALKERGFIAALSVEVQWRFHGWNDDFAWREAMISNLV